MAIMQRQQKLIIGWIFLVAMLSTRVAALGLRGNVKSHEVEDVEEEDWSEDEEVFVYMDEDPDSDTFGELVEKIIDEDPTSETFGELIINENPSMTLEEREASLSREERNLAPYQWYYDYSINDYDYYNGNYNYARRRYYRNQYYNYYYRRPYNPYNNYYYNTNVRVPYRYGYNYYGYNNYNPRPQPNPPPKTPQEYYPWYP